MSVTEQIISRYRKYFNDRSAKLTAASLPFKAPVPSTAPAPFPAPTVPVKNVAIVGAGMSGLYAALLLKENQPDVQVKMFEATDRVGGRVYTHWFEKGKKNQYFEAGAMRLPETSWQEPVFDLIKYLNARLPKSTNPPIQLIPYNYSCPSGNRVYVNGRKQNDGDIMTVDYANDHLDELGFPQSAGATEEAGKLLQDAMNSVAHELLEDFKSALEKYDCMTLNYYLSQECKWSYEKINYVEVMSSQTNEFHLGLVDQVILNSDFTGQVVKQWKTIDQGMSRLPDATAKLIGEENIVLNAPITSLEYLSDDHVEVGYALPGQEMRKESFDAVILALPPSSVRMIPTRPTWSVALEHGLRATNFQPLYKIGLRFKSRFWEEDDLRASKGGQSITDLPCRWVVYPSYGIGDEGQGVLLLYSWMTDSNHWLPKTKLEKVNMALSNLQELYPEVDISDLYAGGKEGDESYLKEAFPVEWAVQWPLGDATFYPNQFRYLFPVMQQPQGQIYFAGEHLSMYHTWIVGALDSAKCAVSQLLAKEVAFLKQEF